MPEASFPVEMISGVPVVVTPEEIDITNASELRMALLDAAAQGNGALVVDMSKTQFCDSAGLNVLVRAHQRAKAQGYGASLVVSGGAILRLLAVTGIERVIPCFRTLDEALAQQEPTGTTAVPVN